MNKDKPNNEIIIYQGEGGLPVLEVHIENETVWLSIEQMAELFDKGRSTINEHILNIYKKQELSEDNSIRKIGNTDFSTKPTNYYNLDVIISVGYRVKSIRGTQFRQWATARLREYIVKGFTMDDERLKMRALHSPLRHIYTLKHCLILSPAMLPYCLTFWSPMRQPR